MSSPSLCFTPLWLKSLHYFSFIFVQSPLTTNKERRDEISPHFDEDEQSEQGKMFEALADMTDDDGALAEMQDLGLL